MSLKYSPYNHHPLSAKGTYPIRWYLDSGFRLFSLTITFIEIQILTTCLELAQLSENRLYEFIVYIYLNTQFIWDSHCTLVIFNQSITNQF